MRISKTKKKDFALNGYRFERDNIPTADHKILLDYKFVCDLAINLRNTAKSINGYYKAPIIAPNGRLEGICLQIRRLNGLAKQLEEIT